MYFLDLTYLENENEYLESTGCLIFDDQNNKIYCGISERATAKAIDIIINDIKNIEDAGGGSCRCMIAEIF